MADNREKNDISNAARSTVRSLASFPAKMTTNKTGSKANPANEAYQNHFRSAKKRNPPFRFD